MGDSPKVGMISGTGPLGRGRTFSAQKCSMGVIAGASRGTLCPWLGWGAPLALKKRKRRRGEWKFARWVGGGKLHPVGTLEVSNLLLMFTQRHELPLQGGRLLQQSPSGFQLIVGDADLDQTHPTIA